MKIKDFFWAILVALAWGFNFVVIEVGLDSFPPLLFSALRFLLVAFPAVFFLSRGNIGWRWIISIGIIMGVIMFSLVFMGMYVGMPAGLSSIVLQIQAVFTILLSTVILRDAPSMWQKVGITVAFVGMGLLAADKYQTASFLGLTLVVAAGFAWAVANILMKAAGDIDMFRLIIWMSIIPPIPLLVISLIFERGHVAALTNMSLTGAGAIIYTALVSTVFAMSTWAGLFRKYSPNVVAPFSLLVPIFGISSSAIFLGQSLTYIELISSLLVFSGLSLIVFGSRLASIRIIRSR